MLFENESLVYVGETGSIVGHITDMLNSRHHTIRRSLGEKDLIMYLDMRKLHPQLSILNILRKWFRIFYLVLKYQ